VAKTAGVDSTRTINTSKNVLLALIMPNCVPEDN